MQSIATKTLPATNTKPARIVATTASGIRRVESRSHDGPDEQQHACVALELARSLDWTGTLIAGATRDGYVFVFDNGGRYTI